MVVDRWRQLVTGCCGSHAAATVQTCCSHIIFDTLRNAMHPPTLSWAYCVPWRACPPLRRPSINQLSAAVALAIAPVCVLQYHT